MILPSHRLDLTKLLEIVVGMVVLGTLGCQRAGEQVVVYTSVDQVFSEPIFHDFEQKTGIRVRAVFDTEETKSTGVLNRLIAESQSPQADVFWSGDPVRPFLLMKRGLVEPYASPNASQIPEAFRARDGSWTGFAARARVILVNRNRIAGAEPPRSVRDLAEPRWKGQTAIANPVFGTTTMHAAALFEAWGADAAKAFFDRLKANDVRIASSNGEVKRLVVAGEVAFGVADTDDADEAIREKAPVMVVYPDQDGGGTLIIPTAVVLIKGAPHVQNGRKLVDFLVSPDVERRMAETAAHMPLRPDVPVPENVRRASDIKAMPVDYARLADVMEQVEPWLREWAGLK